ncbi:MAG: peptidylprolyl isomerase [Firmicutes bacterium]|nr:peptidylprolyl isomerase [Bacillota bacterium]
MKKIIFPLAILLLAGFLGASCNADPSPYAARVNGTVISTSTLSSAIQDAIGNKSYTCLIGNRNIEGAGGSGTYNTSFVGNILDVLIENQIFSQAVKKMKLSESTLTSEVAGGLLANAFSSNSTACPTPGAAVLAAFGPTFRQALLGIYQAEAAIGLKLANLSTVNNGIMKYAAAHRNLTDLSCVSVIETPTAQSMQTVRKQIIKGDPFATAASTYSESPTGSQGGALGCFATSTLPANLAKPLQNLKVGKLSSIVKDNGQYLLFTITSKEFPTEVDVATQIVQDRSTGAQSILNNYLSKAQVDLPSGTWEKHGGHFSVAAPPGPAQSLVPNPASVTP